MVTTIEQQVALDEALVPSTKRFRIGRSNFRLPSDIQSKESTLQVVYDVLCRCPFFKAFLVTTDVPEIYMQEFWAIAYVHEYSIRFKMDIKKNIVDLETFRDMLYICPRVLGQSFDELPFEEEILDFLRFFGHSAQIKTLTDVNNTQQYGAILPIELTNDEIRNTKAYKEYYACATGEAAPKPKASVRRKKSSSDTSITPPTAITTPITTIVLRRSRQESHISQFGGSSTDEGTGSKPGVSDVPSDDSEEEISWNSSEDEDDDDDEEEIVKIDEPEDIESGSGDDEETKSDEDSDEEETREEEEESFDPIPRTPEDSEDDGNGEKDQGLMVSEEQRLIEEEEADELYRDVDINQGRGLQLSADIKDSHVTLTLVNPDGQQESSSVSSQFVSNMLNPTSDTDKLKSLEVNFSEFIQTNQFAEAVSNISDKTILDSYGETTILKKRREDDDDQEGPSTGSDRGSKRQREGGDPESARALLEHATRSPGRSTTGSKSRQVSARESAFAEEPV
nr:hypothetical protein [Tanacetum cinerariifolium]